jgi:N-acetylmuramoyl-L-alanine amidase
MTRAEIFAAMTEQQVLGLTAWAEARGDRRQGHSSIEERIAVMLVIRNRVRNYQKFKLPEGTYKAVCLARWQFSCWNDDPKDGNHVELMKMAVQEIQGTRLDPLLEETLWLAGGIIEHTILDTIGGAMHYYAPLAMKPPGRIPEWAIGKQPVAEVGKQLFFKLF